MENQPTLFDGGGGSIDQPCVLWLFCFVLFALPRTACFSWLVGD